AAPDPAGPTPGAPAGPYAGPAPGPDPATRPGPAGDGAAVRPGPVVGAPGGGVAELRVIPVRGLPDFRPGDDLAGALAAALPWLADGDVVVVTSKAVSKVEGRLVPVPADPAGREAARQAAVDAETVRVVAARGRTRIVETRHGLVLAAAGVDASNVRPGELALLPVDPDASARRLRDALRRLTGRTVAVVVSDTMGRPWRTGVVDVAIGAAGIRAVDDLRGATDTHGMRLGMTEVAVADQVAAAAELAKGKLSGVPVAVVRGLAPVDDPRGARGMLRSPAEDLFRLGTAEAVEQGRRAALADLAAPEPPAHADARATLAAWTPPDEDQRSLATVLLAYLDARPDATRRACRPGHLTASALVLDATGSRVLLTLHPRVGAWVPLGGHLEPEDATLAAAAAREAAEESGIPDLRLDPVPLHVGVHPVTCSLGVPTRHLDVTFLLTAPDGARPVRSDESDDLAWFPVDALPAGAVADLPPLLAHGAARLAGTG
ncbi:MAG: Coenzyme F420-0:L-glutamate ligase @ F420-1:L-glutamate ligase / Nitroreductase family protein Rcas_3978, partial [uncultured Corynebacteriales bacterium]